MKLSKRPKTHPNEFFCNNSKELQMVKIAQSTNTDLLRDFNSLLNGHITFLFINNWSLIKNATLFQLQDCFFRITLLLVSKRLLYTRKVARFAGLFYLLRKALSFRSISGALQAHWKALRNLCHFVENIGLYMVLQSNVGYFKLL